MLAFLESIAKGYATRYYKKTGVNDESLRLSEICFVFPNKRAGTFFLKYLREEIGGVFMTPEVTNITDFVTLLSGRQIGTRLDMLLQLYKCYLELVAPGVAQSELPDSLNFDNFRIWGDTVLKDFSDVDMHCVDAEEIFSNLNDFRTLSTDYLSEDQRRVVEEYFGKHLYESSETFWRKFEEWDDGKITEDDEGEKDTDANDKERGQARHKFVYLWQIMWPLYQLFTERMAAQGLATTGQAYRQAKDRLEEYGETILPCKRVVMVGFNALSGSERELFAALKNLDKVADFVWDSTGPILRDRDNTAGRFVAINRKKYPEPEWLIPYLRESDTSELPEHLEKISSPSNALQAKIAGAELAVMHKKLGDEMFRDARVAVIVPDESLLIPILYGLPEEIGTPNLTMGYPLKETSVSTFMSLLRGVQTTQRYSKGGKGYGITELNRLLAHPLSHAILGTSTINKFRSTMQSKRRIVITPDDLRYLSEKGQRLLRQLHPTSSVDEVSGYLHDVLDMVAEAMTRSTGALVRNQLETAHARKWQEALRILTDALHHYDIEMRPMSLMYESERLLSAETVSFKGEPLAGLQIMGLLETRLLDFDHIIILSMNDKIMPRKARQRTFIPDTLRWGYGLPPSNYQESIFGYYFYRLISRAKSVRMLYDSRVGISGGGPSRYLHQLDLLYAGEQLIRSERKLIVTSNESEYEKSGHNEVTERRLAQYKADAAKGKAWSATSLKKYCMCPLRFYLEVICGIKTDTEGSETLGAIEYGNIFHSLMENMYIPEGYIGEKKLYEHPVTITQEKIEGLLGNRSALMSRIVRAINRDFYGYDEENEEEPLPPSTAIIADAMLLQLESTLRHDKELALFDILGCETVGYETYPVDESLQLRMQFRIDRIDRVPTGEVVDGERVYEYRLVDYKTGYVSYKRNLFEEYFVDMNRSDPTFQMMLYAELLNRWPEWRERYGTPRLGLVIYDVGKPNNMREIRLPQIAKENIEYYDEVQDAFNERLRVMLRDIYNPAKEFEAHPSDKQCKYCSFRSMCLR